ncbi:hypothetical protein SAMD00019534_007060 [Acytostelium subglobosum LB1]|uniref:hypothetical protein n=1 Tax=Acytostelium subglobosum LB1 TaxID=1410327 RepID=UPI000644EF01|nr:hypothetical protein SAMD00019534_007060 [Acytostelium subglobosum LB1]GAM17531.1 hypothetical protein SAMD00019534_007060 [Acytostelium subglobosum LB1]|eukprot:XP_012759593.1 hypothetical protein SAMD00019534_007060 [Acytostelium subglobosum LB1]
MEWQLLPLTIMRQLVSCLHSNVDRVMLSLVYTYRADAFTLNAYSNIIDNDVSKHKGISVLVYSRDGDVNIPFFDRSFQLVDFNIDRLSMQVLDVSNISSITFSDSYGQPMGLQFWTNMKDLLEELAERSVTNISFLSWSTPSTLNKLPITAMVIRGFLSMSAQQTNFPDTLTSLTVEDTLFNSSLNHILPMGLKTLDLSGAHSWNQPIEPGALPTGLVTLKLGTVFDHPIEPGTLPSSLRTLSLRSGYTHPLDCGRLPDSLTRLVLTVFEGSIELPNSVTDLTMKMYFTGSNCHQPLQRLNLHTMPSGFNFSQLTHLTIGMIENQDSLWQITSSTLPCLQELDILRVRPSPLDLSRLPSTLKRLNIANCPPITTVASGVEDLQLGCIDTFQLRFGMLPSSITALTLSNYNYELVRDDIPASVTSLTLVGYVHPLPISVLPQSLHTLECNAKSLKDDTGTAGLVDILQQMPSSIKQLVLSVKNGTNQGNQTYRLTRLSSTLLFKHTDDLHQSGFISLDKLEAQIPKQYGLHNKPHLPPLISTLCNVAYT